MTITGAAHYKLRKTNYIGAKNNTVSMNRGIQGYWDLNPHPEKCVASARSSRKPGWLFRRVDRYAPMAKMWGGLFVSNTNGNTTAIEHTMKSFKINTMSH